MSTYIAHVCRQLLIASNILQALGQFPIVGFIPPSSNLRADSVAAQLC
jgi:hypothetical protein